MQVVDPLVQAERPHVRRPRRGAHRRLFPGGPAAFPEPPVRPFLPFGGTRLLAPRREGRAERRLEAGKRHAVLGAPGARQARLYRGEVEGKRIGEDGVPRLAGAEEPLSLAVGLHQLHLFRVAPREEEVPERFVVHGEEGDRGAVLRGHVRDRRPVGHGERGEPLAVELDEFAHHAFPAQHLGDREDEVRGGGARREPAGETEPHDLGDEHGDRLPSMAASASIPPTPQPRTPRPLIIGVCESVPTRVSGYACAPPRTFFPCTTGARYSRFTWWQIPVPGGTTRKFRKDSFPSGGTRTAPRCARIPAPRCPGRRRPSRTGPPERSGR